MIISHQSCSYFEDEEQHLTIVAKANFDEHRFNLDVLSNRLGSLKGLLNHNRQVRIHHLMFAFEMSWWPDNDY